MCIYGDKHDIAFNRTNSQLMVFDTTKTESESESEYLFGHFDPVTLLYKTVADRCRRGHHQNIQYILIT